MQKDSINIYLQPLVPVKHGHLLPYIKLIPVKQWAMGKVTINNQTIQELIIIIFTVST